MQTFRGRRLAGPMVAAVLALAGGGLTACGTDEDDNALAPELEPAAVPDIRGADDIDDPYQGLFDEAFREDLEVYAQQEVTVLADVAEVFGPRAFTITSPDGDVDPVLVVATPDAGDVEPAAGDPVVVAATPVEDLDVEVVTEELGLEAEPDELADWAGETYLVATILEPAP